MLASNVKDQKLCDVGLVCVCVCVSMWAHTCLHMKYVLCVSGTTKRQLWKGWGSAIPQVVPVESSVILLLWSFPHLSLSQYLMYSHKHSLFRNRKEHTFILFSHKKWIYLLSFHLQWCLVTYLGMLKSPGMSFSVVIPLINIPDSDHCYSET